MKVIVYFTFAPETKADFIFRDNLQAIFMYMHASVSDHEIFLYETYFIIQQTQTMYALS